LFIRVGTTSGTFLSILPNILSEDIAKTIILGLWERNRKFYGFAPFEMINKSKNK
jgi:hypothetical protein